MYKISKYNFHVEHNNNFILYNALSDKMFILNKNEFEKISNLLENLSKLEQKHSDLFNYFLQNKFITDNNTNEIEVIKQKYFYALENKNSLFLTILPTLSCNFKCWYCYEKDTVKQTANTKMQPQTINKIVDFVKNQISENSEIKQVFLGWFGGEPLLYYNDVFKVITSRIKNICIEKNIFLYNNIITNGALFTDEILDDFKLLNFYAFQLTLDGNREKHNRVKHTNNKGSYDKIIENIRKISIIFPNAKLTVRLNYDIETLQGVDNIISDLQDIDRQNIVIDFQKIWQIKNTEELQRELEIAKHKFFTNNFKIKITEYNAKKNIACPINSKNNFVVNYDGNLYKCLAREYKNPLAFINEKGYLINNENLSKYYDKTVFDIEECVNCKELPLCMGPCLQKINETKDFSNICFKKKHNIKVEEFIKQKANEILKNIE